MGIQGNGADGSFWDSSLYKRVGQSVGEAKKAALQAQQDMANGSPNTKGKPKQETNANANNDPQASAQMLLAMMTQALQGMVQLNAQNPAGGGLQAPPTNMGMGPPLPQLGGGNAPVGASPTNLPPVMGNSSPAVQQVVMLLLQVLTLLPQLAASGGGGQPQLQPAPPPQANGNPPPPRPTSNPPPPQADLPKPTDPPPVNPRAATYGDLVVSEALKKQSDETDPDGDSVASSQTDLDWMKSLVDQKKLTSSELANALKKQYAQGPATQSDELVVMMAQAVDQGVLSIGQLLDGPFLGELDDGHTAQLATALANMGVQGKNGKPLTQWIGWLLVNSGNPGSPEGKLTQQVLSEMPKAWKEDWATPEGQQVKAFLKDFIGQDVP